LIATLLLILELFDFLINGIVGELSKEHFFFLVDKLICILSSILLRELHTTARNMHGLVDVVDLLWVVILSSRICFGWRDISVLDPM